MSVLTPPSSAPEVAHRDALRRQAVRAFVRRTFGVAGTLRLHRAAFGADLLRAPANVMLAPVFLLVRLSGLLARAVGLRRTGGWLLGRKVLFETRVSAEVGQRVAQFLVELQGTGAGVLAPTGPTSDAVAAYVGVRSAVAEMTTTLIVLATGAVLFHSTTLGVISLAGPVAEMRAQAAAIRAFPLGEGLGRMYYGVFPRALSLSQVVLTGAVLAVLASVVTTFAGVIADPLQVLTGTHRRRLMRLLERLDSPEGGQGLAREHLAARLGDVSDLALSLWRMLRG